ncbi:MAG: FIST C-terminal domain-containing protein [Planctomycetes bacterium]|nr:FIST C-terminal domain-containing protein [Planctomycetota bacterium]
MRDVPEARVSGEQTFGGHTPLRCAAGLSTHPEALDALEQACTQVMLALGGSPIACALVFLSKHHVHEAEPLARHARIALNTTNVLGCSAESVIGGTFELEGSPGISVLAISGGGVSIHPFSSDEVPQRLDEMSPEAVSILAENLLGPRDTLRGAIMLADPFTTPVIKLFPMLNRLLDGKPLVGGMASAAADPGSNVLLAASGDAVRPSGLVGLALHGKIQLDTVVSQGCAPIGPNLVITKCKKNLVFEVGGRSIFEAIREVVESLSDAQREQMKQGLFVGRVIDEYKQQFGRGDYLIRGIVGVDERSGSVAVGDLMRIGQTIRLHIRDGQTAREDLEMLMDAQQLHGAPVGCLLVSCNGRGQRLFGRPNIDAGTVCRAFQPMEPGETRAKIGHAIDSQPGPVPLAGFFGAGEFGPIGRSNFLHGHTAVATLLRAPLGT